MAVRRAEILAWAMFDFANSGYATVVLTAIFNAYFVSVIAGSGSGYASGTATLLWTLAVACANGIVLAGAPLIGAMADHSARKKRYLAITTAGCVVFTAMLALAGPGDVVYALVLVVASNLMFAAGENLIAAFLPEIAEPDEMGRISAYGWSLGYIGGVLVLVLCLAVVFAGERAGWAAADYVPLTLLVTAACFGLAALPTFVVLRERAQPIAASVGATAALVAQGYRRLRHTVRHARHFRDLFRFLVTLTVYYAGIHTVVVLAAVYAQQVMGFTTTQTIVLILVVNVTAAAGAFAFGHLQDRIGSVRALMLTLYVWIAAMIIAYLATGPAMFWVAANLVGIAMGSSQSAGRALVGQFTPRARAAEFFGLWGLAAKLAAVLGPLSYGLVGYLSGGNHRLALLVTTGFFVIGALLLRGVDEARGRASAACAT